MSILTGYLCSLRVIINKGDGGIGKKKKQSYMSYKLKEVKEKEFVVK